MDIVIQHERPNKCFNREKLGEGALFAFDETKRALVVCARTKVSPRQCSLPRRANQYITRDQLQLYFFIFDESYKTLQAQGSTINLATWYSSTETSILHVAFVCGNEEVVLVDSSAQARIFSFVTLQFRYYFPFHSKHPADHYLLTLSKARFIATSIHPRVYILVSRWFLSPCSSHSRLKATPHCVSLGIIRINRRGSLRRP